jgi:hypothetical protein
MALGTATNFVVPPHLVSDGVPTAGTDEVQTLTTSGTVTAGTFRLSFGGFMTGTIAWNATTSVVETALNNLPSCGAGGTASVGVAVTGGAFPGTAFTVTFSGANVAKKVQPLLVLHRNDLTGGGTVVIAEQTPGVDAFGRGAPDGAQAINGQTGVLYFNAGSANLPVWNTAT